MAHPKFARVYFPVDSSDITRECLDMTQTDFATLITIPENSRSGDLQFSMNDVQVHSAIRNDFKQYCTEFRQFVETGDIELYVTQEVPCPFVVGKLCSDQIIVYDAAFIVKTGFEALASLADAQDIHASLVHLCNVQAWLYKVQTISWIDMPALPAKQHVWFLSKKNICDLRSIVLAFILIQQATRLVDERLAFIDPSNTEECTKYYYIIARCYHTALFFLKNASGLCDMLCSGYNSWWSRSFLNNVMDYWEDLSRYYFMMQYYDKDLTQGNNPIAKDPVRLNILLNIVMYFQSIPAQKRQATSKNPLSKLRHEANRRANDIHARSKTIDTVALFLKQARHGIPVSPATKLVHFSDQEMEAMFQIDFFVDHVTWKKPMLDITLFLPDPSTQNSIEHDTNSHSS